MKKEKLSINDLSPEVVESMREEIRASKEYQSLFVKKINLLKQHGRRRKAKRPFESMGDAIEYMEKRNLLNKYNAYKCHVCNKWHIGHKID